MQNPNSSSSSMVDPNSSAPKRYTPPNQRNRSSNRRRSRGSSHSNEGEKSQLSDVQRENSAPKIISLGGCSKGEAFQLLSDRWAAAMHLYNDPTVDLSERPVMYYGGDVWGKLPNKILASANKPLHPPILPKDHRAEPRRGLTDSKVAKF